ncbi:uncharacterized protein LOC113646049 isoform X2 [Tachysurus fulvidraco]|uniref:uncharacterized protein LOC113646049 isoform X2 n=1 Tax=Tachysurus fulvidraco TaxID=1234273 RepID=UPI001FF04C5A|nr:uncharacterized protein LOC113646049 isoform X2 [Tachysurus fulvidraco]
MKISSTQYKLCIISPLKMTPIWTILLFLNTITSSQAVDFSRPSFLSVRPGQRVALNCPFGNIPKAESVVWYRQIIGKMPQKVGEKSTYKNINISDVFKTSGFKMEENDKGISLTIQHIKKEDGGLYYCGRFSWEYFTLSSGTFLVVKDDRDVKVSVWQRGMMDPVPAGASVTLQCSVLSESRAAELQVLWFRAAPPQSHPQIIYTHHNSSHQCEIDSSHTCVYNFSKNILSLNDTGTYYCAVLLCGKIVFGNGTSVQMENFPENALGPEVFYLTVVVVVCVVVIFTQTFIICKMRNCVRTRASRPQQGSRAEKTPNKDADAEELNYTSLHFSKKNTKRVSRNRDKPEDCIYSEVLSGT